MKSGSFNGPRLPVGHEDKNIIETLLNQIIGVLSRVLLHTVVDGSADAERNHHSDAVIFAVNIDKLFGGRKLIVAVENLGIEALDNIADDPVRRAVGPGARLLENLLKLLGGTENETVDADVGRNVAGLLVGVVVGHVCW